LNAEHIQMFVSVLTPYSDLPPAKLERRCVGLVGAGEALSAALVREQCSAIEAAKAFAGLIQGGLHGPLQGSKPST